MRKTLLAPAMLGVLLSGCGSGDGEDTPAPSPPPPYPASLSTDSTPSEVANVLIKALDEKDTKTLQGLVAVRTAGKELKAIDRRPGKEYGPAKVAALVAAGCRATYAFFKKGETEVTGADITDEIATVRARGKNKEDKPMGLVLPMVREDGLWKIKPIKAEKVRGGS